MTVKKEHPHLTRLQSKALTVILVAFAIKLVVTQLVAAIALVAAVIGVF